jgi:hypothetical protein
MHGPTCIFWANLTPLSRKADEALSAVRQALTLEVHI